MIFLLVNLGLSGLMLGVRHRLGWRENVFCVFFVVDIGMLKKSWWKLF